MTPQATRASTRSELRAAKPATWIAVEPGDDLIGEVIDVDVAWSDVQGQNGDGWYPLLTVKVEQAVGYEKGAELAVHGFATVLRNEILRREPRPGETVKIQYLGTGEASRKGQSPPEIYRVRVLGRDPKEAAQHVYGQLKPRGQQPMPGQGQGGQGEPDVPIDSEGLPDLQERFGESIPE